MNVELEIYYHTDQTTSLQKMDMGFHITDCDTKIVTLCNVVGFGPAKEEDGFTYGRIFTAAGDFSTPLKYEELKKLFK